MRDQERWFDLSRVSLRATRATYGHARARRYKLLLTAIGCAAFGPGALARPVAP